MFVGQAFLYNAVTFNLGTLLSGFFGVASGAVPYFTVIFAVGNFAGPFLLGRLFDTVGRKPMIAGTYLLSSALTVLLALLLVGGDLTRWSFIAIVGITFFFASAGASSAYLTVSEIFPMETRALAIAFFYAIGTGVGGITGPLLFGNLINSGSETTVAIGFFIGRCRDGPRRDRRADLRRAAGEHFGCRRRSAVWRCAEPPARRRRPRPRPSRVNRERAEALAAEHRPDAQAHAELAQAAAERARASEQRALAQQARGEADSQEDDTAGVSRAQADAHDAWEQMHDARGRAHAARVDGDERLADQQDRKPDRLEQRALAAEERLDAARHHAAATTIGREEGAVAQTAEQQAEAAERARRARERDERIRQRLLRQQQRERHGWRRFRPEAIVAS